MPDDFVGFTVDDLHDVAVSVVIDFDDDLISVSERVLAIESVRRGR